MTISKITNCARCGETHENVVATKFLHPVLKDDGSIDAEFWAKCPNSGDPILIWITSDPPVAGKE